MTYKNILFYILTFLPIAEMPLNVSQNLLEFHYTIVDNF